VKRATKAALLSGLVCPGVGHIWLKQYLRGSILMLLALAAAYVIFTVAFQQAQTIVDSIVSGDIPAETGAIADMLSDASNDSDSTALTACKIIFGACWLLGIIDSYRLGKELDK
jgi:hypothetical protein